MRKREYTWTGFLILAFLWCVGMTSLGLLAKLNWYLIRLGWSLV